MRRRTVALDDKLPYMRDILESEGYDVVGLVDGYQKAGAVVVSGMDDNLVGVQNRMFEGNVINAEGRNPEEILEEVRRTIELQ